MYAKKQWRKYVSIYPFDRSAIQEGIAIDDYHNREINPGLSSTNFRHISTSPEYAYHKRMHPGKPTKDMQEGSMLHSIITEPETFEDHYMLTPKISRKSNAGKEAYAKYMEEADGKQLVNQDQWDMALQVRDSVKANREANLLISGTAPHHTRVEVSGFLYNKDKQTVKARPDVISKYPVMSLADIKSRQGGAAARDIFLKDLINHKIYLQAALQVYVWESAGIPIENYYYILVEKAPPFQAVVYPLDRQFIDLGIIELNDLSIRWERWMEDPTPGYGYYQQRLEPPAWFIKKHGDSDE